MPTVERTARTRPQAATAAQIRAIANGVMPTVNAAALSTSTKLTCSSTGPM
jgi:hypothetical protein